MSPTPEVFLLDRLIRITPRRVYAELDIDTLRDGGWWMPQGCVQRLHALMNAHRLFPYNSSGRGLTARRVPLSVVVEVAEEAADILQRYRRDHSALRGGKRSG